MILPEENPSFYDILHNKGNGLTENMVLLKEFAGKRRLKIKSALQYDDGATKNFGVPRVFLLSDDTSYFKIRICNSTSEALRIGNNLGYALSNGVPVSRVIEVSGPLVLLEYILGEKINELSQDDIKKISKIHSLINHPIEFKGYIEENLENMILSSMDILPKSDELSRMKDAFYDEFPESFIPVFDHQDFGVNNIIKGKGQFFVIDEEAFGILPFGYTLHRAIKGRRKYNVCNSEEEMNLYLSNLLPIYQAYYSKTRKFWEIVYKIREGARIFVSGNKDLAMNVLKNDQ